MTMLEAYFDELLARMQTPEWRAAAQRAFDATPEEIGKAAVEHAGQNRESAV
jgi:antitoxin Phd